MEDRADVEAGGYWEGRKGSVCRAIAASIAVGVATCRLRPHPPPPPGRQAGRIEETRQVGRAAAPSSMNYGRYHAANCDQAQCHAKLKSPLAFVQMLLLVGYSLLQSTDKP